MSRSTWWPTPTTPTARSFAGCWPKGNHLVTRVKRNSVAYFPAPSLPPGQPRRRGRPGKYGKKIKVASLLKNPGRIQEAASPVYGEENVTIRFQAADLWWRPAGVLVRFVAVNHPRRGTIRTILIPLMSKDLNLAPVDIIRIYRLRFKIEVAFKQSLRVIGTYAYHFWMAAIAMQHTLPEFIAGGAKTSIFVKFLRDRIDLSRAEGIHLAA